MKDCTKGERSITGWAAKGVEIFSGMIGGSRKMTRDVKAKAKQVMLRLSLLFSVGMTP